MKPVSQTSKEGNQKPKHHIWLVAGAIGLGVLLVFCGLAGFLVMRRVSADNTSTRSLVQSILGGPAIIDTTNLEFTPEEYEMWAIGCSAIIASTPGYNRYQFGMGIQSNSFAADTRASLKEYWGIENREDLVRTIDRMTHGGHNVRFIEAYDLVSSPGFNPLNNNLFEDDGYFMWPLTKSIGDKWGDKHIEAWDWFRMIHLAVWGYSANYLTREEAYALMTPIIRLLRSEFSSWDEANDNYLDGYAWWSRANPDDSWNTYIQRRDIYRDIRSSPILFNPSVWEN